MTTATDQTMFISVIDPEMPCPPRAVGRARVPLVRIPCVVRGRATVPNGTATSPDRDYSPSGMPESTESSGSVVDEPTIELPVVAPETVLPVAGRRRRRARHSGLAGFAVPHNCEAIQDAKNVLARGSEVIAAYELGQRTERQQWERDFGEMAEAETPLSRAFQLGREFQQRVQGDVPERDVDEPETKPERSENALKLSYDLGVRAERRRWEADFDAMVDEAVRDALRDDLDDDEPVSSDVNADIATHPTEDEIESVGDLAELFLRGYAAALPGVEPEPDGEPLEEGTPEFRAHLSGRFAAYLRENPFRFEWGGDGEACDV